MIDTIHIYTLSDPDSGFVRYVGKAKNIRQRFYLHLYEVKKRFINTKKNAWIKHLLNLGKEPVIEVLEVIESENENEWKDAEKFWITTLRFLGLDLTNLCDGGEGLSNPSKETREKIGAYSKTRIHSPETRARISAASKKNMTDAAKKHLSEYQKLNPQKHTEETKKLISESKKGKPRSQEVLDKLWANNIKSNCLKNYNVLADSIHRASLILGEKIPFPTPKQPVPKQSCREVALARTRERKDKFVAAGIKVKAAKGWHITPAQIGLVKRVFGEDIVNSCPDDGIISEAIAQQSGQFTSSALYEYGISKGITRIAAVSAVLRAVEYGLLQIVSRGKGMRPTVYINPHKSPETPNPLFVESVATAHTQPCGDGSFSVHPSSDHKPSPRNAS